MSAILGRLVLGQAVLGQGAGQAAAADPSVRRRSRPAPQRAPFSGRVRRSPVPPTGESPPPGLILQGRRESRRNLEPSRGSVRRSRPPVPDDQTPILPPVRRYSRRAHAPVDLDGRVGRSTPKPPFVPPDPGVPPRRYSRSLSFIPPEGSVRRGRPVLNEIGPSTPVERARSVRAVVRPFPGRVTRGRLPVPDPEPQVLPPRRTGVTRAALSMATVWLPERLRKLPQFGPVSPASAPACPYRPHALDDSDGMAARPDDSDGPSPSRCDEADSLPTRVDECQ